MLSQAFNVIRDAVANGGIVLFVGTKRQAQETVAEEAARCGMPYVTERWMGGMLTNWSTMYARIQELERLEKMRDTGELDRLTKKEGLLIGREITRLTTRLSGTRTMKRRPDLLFIIDVGREEAAVHEANLLNIPIVAMVDTNCNPQEIDYVIPSNDDAIRAIKLLVAKAADAVLEGKAMRKEEEEEKPEDMAARTDRQARKPKVVETDEEMEDDALLGEATLAKMNAAAEAEAESQAKKAEAELEARKAEAETKAAEAKETEAQPGAEKADNPPVDVEDASQVKE
jgi:small subunit ribosomal protein S2